MFLAEKLVTSAISSGETVQARFVEAHAATGGGEPPVPPWTKTVTEQDMPRRFAS
jgi:hypothetical protein